MTKKKPGAKRESGAWGWVGPEGGGGGESGGRGGGEGRGGGGGWPEDRNGDRRRFNHHGLPPEIVSTEMVSALSEACKTTPQERCYGIVIGIFIRFLFKR